MAQENHTSFLHRKLEPPKQLPIDDGCLPGTRKTVLSDMDAWLRNYEDRNVLWVSGVPGAGKSAVASTIVRKLLGSEDYPTHNSAKFFIKRGNATLEDPRVIWRSIANDLAEMSRTDQWYRSIKLDILEVMSRKSSALYPHDISIEEQFRALICEPLKSLFAHGPTSPRRIVVVIDALDECNTDNGDEWLAFLDTIIKWSEELPKTCKLLVTSRPEAEIEQKLKDISRPLALDTGVDVLKESSHDIELLFKERFREMQVGQKGFDSIGLLTTYAAGLFIWATTVIEFLRAGAFEERLQEVLANMSAARGIHNRDKIGLLYGQILVKVAIPRLYRPRELETLSLTLASVVLLRRPLPLQTLGVLVTPELDRPSSDITRVIDGLRSVIVTEGSRVPRERHKSFSDFLLDDKRVKSAVESLLPKNLDTQATNLEQILGTFSLVRQHALIAKCCMQVMVFCTSNPFPKTNKSLAAALAYACNHWVDHFQSAGTEGYTNSDLHTLPIETLPQIQKRAFRWIRSLSTRSVYELGHGDHLYASLSESGAVALSFSDNAKVVEELTKFATVSRSAIMGTYFNLCKLINLLTDPSACEYYFQGAINCI